ncbi:MAG: PQQ-binding-like beta-propeller repeat protein [Phycisphaerales bacterium]|nr:PQQ-binding-like beta-propeller repeat protein [Phycisphaerales bacterium]
MLSGHAQVTGWLNWRGPQQTGESAETSLPSDFNAASALWTAPIHSRGTPVIAHTPQGDRLYLWGYTGEREKLREGLWCLDADTGKVLWQHLESDFLSDVVYDRYAIGAPVVDPRTGNIYWLTSAGLFSAFNPEGKLLWQHSMMEEYGRLTFPNGRSGAPVIEGDLVIVQGITSNWGSDGPARNRFYAFDTLTGDLVWSSTPGTQPKDSTFSTPILADWNGQRVLYAGTGCGHVVAINARTGKPLWRYLVSMGGVNASVILHRAGTYAEPV